MRRLALLPLLCLACNFDGSTGATSTNDGGSQIDADPTLPDASPPPDAVTSCEPNALVCSGDRLETCNAEGTGIVPSSTVVCDFACVDDSRCLGTSNLSGIDTDVCDQPGVSVALTPQSGSEILLEDSGSGPRITCIPDCGDGSTQVIPAAKIISNTLPNIAMFCLSVLDLPASTGLKTEGNITEAIALIVQSSATIAGDIDVSGGSYSPAFEFDTRAPAGPGGGRGAGIGMGTGEGACPGTGGATVGGFDDHVGAGGGGGAAGGNGGDGGRGKSDSEATATGGSGGNSCGITQQLVPLRGGSGGGSGGDGKSVFVSTSGPGGGGAGALQISARDFITLMGNIVANGGDGYSSGFSVSDHGGGGGGGSGGAILLEAPIVTITGTLSVEGGDGGDGSAGDGGDGAGDGNMDGTAGANEDGEDQSGGGGGGGAGVIRLNATTAPTCTNISPSGSCSAGVMPAN